MSTEKAQAVVAVVKTPTATIKIALRRAALVTAYEYTISLRDLWYEGAWDQAAALATEGE